MASGGAGACAIMAGPCAAAEPPSGGSLLPEPDSAKFYQRWHGPAALSLCPKGSPDGSQSECTAVPGCHLSSRPVEGHGARTPNRRGISHPRTREGDAAPMRDGASTRLYALPFAIASQTPVLSVTINHELTIRTLPSLLRACFCPNQGDRSGQGQFRWGNGYWSRCFSRACSRWWQPWRWFRPCLPDPLVPSARSRQ